MLKRELYQQAYMYLDRITPLPADCGRLCGAACCKCGDDESGMYLFPGEEAMYRRRPWWMSIEKSDFEYAPGRFANIAICRGVCDRSMRPLACRIFPLTPYYEGDSLKAVMDRRGAGVCPLVRYAGVERLRPEFVGRVLYMFRFLSHNSDIRRFIKGLSGLMDDLRRFTD